MQQCRVTMGRNAYGHPEPRIEVRFSKGLHFRKMHAALNLLAAAVELATSAEEGWIVEKAASSTENVGWIYLELLRANEEEAQRGLQVLHCVSRSQYTGETK